MRVIFLDIDGVLNSAQSATFWHHSRDQKKWENEGFKEWKGTLMEYLAMEWDPIALANVEELLRRVPDLQVVISSTWRLGETIDGLKGIFAASKLIASKIIDKTPNFGHGKLRGDEIKYWLDKHPEVTDYVIIDDDSDMLESQKKNFVNTSSLHGFQYGDMLWALRILKEGGKE